jgi:FAD/FMN-containing dehydrogenase
MPWSGSANINGPGVTIDLGLMNATTVSNDKNVAHVQPGARWGSVYDTLDPEGRVAVGGRGEDVGVGVSFWALRVYNIIKTLMFCAGGFLLGGEIVQFS